jgi:hypothetical protein
MLKYAEKRFIRRIDKSPQELIEVLSAPSLLSSSSLYCAYGCRCCGRWHAQRTALALWSSYIRFVGSCVYIL